MHKYRLDWNGCGDGAEDLLKWDNGMKAISPITEAAQKRIEKQRMHVKKIMDLSERIAKYQKSEQNKYESMYLSEDDIDVIARALMCHMAVINSDVQKQEKALKCGSEGGDLQSQSEKNILNGCLSLLYEVAGYFWEYLDFVGFEPETEEEDLHFNMSYGHIVKMLFLWHTHHSGGTSTAAKCRELGVDYSETINICEREKEL